MTSQLLYDQVAIELMTSPPNPGLWARAYAIADGDLAKARARYITLRVGQLESQFIAERDNRMREAFRSAEDAASQKPEKSRRGWPYLTEEECITELAHLNHSVTREGKELWLVMQHGEASGKRAKSLYDLQRMIAELWQ